METYDASWPAAGGGQFPNPDGPLPGPFPPIPGPYPEIPWPPRQPLPDFPLELPRDFWRCRRLGPVSGRYEGGRNGATALLRATLDLRVDIDERQVNSPVMNRISGDLYSSRFVMDGPMRSFRTMKTYRESWIVDNPGVVWRRCSVAITGRVRWWKGSHLPTDVTIIIPWNLGAMGPAQVTMVAGASTDVYSCAYRSESFRQVQLETDYCRSVNANPQLPAYDTHAHTNRPAGTPQRVLTVQETYREAGIEITVTSAHTDIDDSAAQFQSWNVAELHDAMEVHFSQLAGGWPRWHLWGLLAGTFEQSSVGGIMFDYSGANEPPERQGFAVFRKHSWFNGLPGGAPANQAEAEAMRKFLYTWVHEAGHAFNFLHSWDKSRPSARSWMNYDWKYDAINGADSFWANFQFRFDDEELIHLRHGDRSSVIMGGDPWSSGGHLESPPEAMTQTDSDAPLELLLRSKGYFEFMEPVTIEARLRNTGTSPVGVDARLTTESGNLAVFVRKPTGQVRRFVPVSCHLAEPVDLVLEPLAADGSNEGRDRFSEAVPLIYSSTGFVFDEPGEYLIRAVYHGAAFEVSSNTLRMRVGLPLSRAEDRRAQDFFTYQVGTSLYLEGSESPFLKAGMDQLREAVKAAPATAMAVAAAQVLATSDGRDFHRIADSDGRKLVLAHRADPESAVATTTDALAFFRKRRSAAEAKSLNLPYARLVRSRAVLLRSAGNDTQARSELDTLAKDLKAHGANAPVVATIAELAKAK